MHTCNPDKDLELNPWMTDPGQGRPGRRPLNPCKLSDEEPVASLPSKACPAEEYGTSANCFAGVMLTPPCQDIHRLAALVIACYPASRPLMSACVSHFGDAFDSLEHRDWARAIRLVHKLSKSMDDDFTLDIGQKNCSQSLVE